MPDTIVSRTDTRGWLLVGSSGVRHLMAVEAMVTLQRTFEQEAVAELFVKVGDSQRRVFVQTRHVLSWGMHVGASQPLEVLLPEDGGKLVIIGLRKGRDKSTNFTLCYQMKGDVPS